MSNSEASNSSVSSGVMFLVGLLCFTGFWAGYLAIRAVGGDPGNPEGTTTRSVWIQSWNGSVRLKKGFGNADQTVNRSGI